MTSYNIIIRYVRPNAFGKRIIIASAEGAKAPSTARQYLLNLQKIGASRIKEGGPGNAGAKKGSSLMNV